MENDDVELHYRKGKKKRRCRCVAAIVIVLVLLVIGIVIGYFIGKMHKSDSKKKEHVTNSQAAREGHQKNLRDSIDVEKLDQTSRFVPNAQLVRGRNRS